MITKSSVKKSDMYYAALGPVKATLGCSDLFRFRRVRKYLRGNSVLDVGCGKAGFLSLIKNDYEIAGTEVNEERIDYCNQVLGQDVITLGNLDGELAFGDASFDTVVCLEVLEHLEDPGKAFRELVRVSRKRVIATVPFNEGPQWFLCLHCARYTPESGHLHTFNRENVKSIIPADATTARIGLICNDGLISFPGLRSVFRLPTPISSAIDSILNRVIPRARWMMIILDKN